MKDSEPYEKNTREQYERLGRFVESFEAMVHQVRSSCMMLMGETVNQTLLEIIFHHPTMTANPLFEIFRAMLVATISDEEFRKAHKVEVITVNTFQGVLAQISTEYSLLTKIRNSLLHGTWFVGYVGDDPTSPEFEVYKYSIGKNGISRDDLPRTAAELASLSERCEETRDLISLIHSCVPPAGQYYQITDHFRCVDKKWERTWTWQDKQTPKHP